MDVPIPNSTVPEICCKLTCPSIGTVINIPERCQDKPELYDTFLDDQSSLTTDEAETIVNNLNWQQPNTIVNILQQSATLALN
jgi:hypothetical protein